MTLTQERNAAAYLSAAHWKVERPHILVACCSDGRLQEAIDEFLQNSLNIRDYDRVYAPGGPGALVPAPGGGEAARAEQYRSDMGFLVRVHEVQELLLIFHGAAPDGPQDSTCAHYQRVMPGSRPEEIRQQQGRDLVELRNALGEMGLTPHIRAFRAEVRANRQVQFVPMEAGT